MADTRDENFSIKEEYKLWKKHTPILYDSLLTHTLEWPSLTVEWLPDRDEPAEQDYRVQQLILGTLTADNEPNYLIRAQVQLRLEHSMSNANYDDDDANFDDDRSDMAGIRSSNEKIQIIQEINHDGEVNRARYMPKHPFITATKAVNGEVYVFDLRQHPSQPRADGACHPDMRLRGHHDEGCGLSWNKLKCGHILSGADDGQICLWDVNATPENKALDAMQIFKVDKGVEDVAWHVRNECLFGSVGYDKYLHIWDLRSSRAARPILSVMAHKHEVNCLSFNPSNEWYLATGSSDKTVKVFDLRNISTVLHTFNCHEEEVFQVGWNPLNEAVLASSCVGRRVMVWDCRRIGWQQTPEEAEEGPPELLFLHGGHTSNVPDFSWNPCEEWMIASVAADNILHIWQMAEGIYHDKDDLPA